MTRRIGIYVTRQTADGDIFLWQSLSLSQRRSGREDTEGVEHQSVVTSQFATQAGIMETSLFQLGKLEHEWARKCFPDIPQHEPLNGVAVIQSQGPNTPLVSVHAAGF